MDRKFIGMLAGVVMISVPAFGIPVYSTGFESTETPPFVVGTLAPQNLWLKQDVGTGAGSAVVQNDVVKTGTQAVAVTKAPNTSTFVFRPVTVVTNATTDRYVYVSADVQYDRSSASTSIFGPFVGLDIFQGNNRVATAGFDSMTNDFLIYDPTLVNSGGTLVPNGLQPTGPGVAAPQTWYKLLVSLDFTAKVYHLYVNGIEYTPAAGIGFVTPSATTITDGDFAVLPADGDAAAQAATTTGYFDNFSVSTNSVVPEPASAAAILLGGATLLARRRRNA